MQNIPEFKQKPTVIIPPKAPEPVEDVIRKEYESTVALAESYRKSNQEEYDAMYKRLCEEFVSRLPEGQTMKIQVGHVSSCPFNRSDVKHATPSKYQLLAIEQFAYELRQKKYDVSHKEIVDYTDKDDYYDYCDCYYVVTVNL